MPNEININLTIALVLMNIDNKTALYIMNTPTNSTAAKVAEL